MDRRPLGRGPLAVSVIGLGCYAFSGVYGPRDAAQFERVIRRAHEIGITLFDTSDSYGNAEEVLGAALKPVRHEVLVATKAGLVCGDRFSDTSASYIRSACEASLRRLGTDVIDLYQVHFDDPATPVSETAGALETLVCEGKIRAWGVSHLPAERIEAFLATGHASSVMMEYNLLATGGFAELEPVISRFRPGVIAFSATARGLLTGSISNSTAFSPGDIRGLDPLFRPASVESALVIVDVLRRIGLRYSKTPVQVAIAWLLSQPHVSSALVGPSSIAHLEENAGGAGWSLAQEDIDELSMLAALRRADLRSQRLRRVANLLESGQITGHEAAADLLDIATCLVEEKIVDEAEVIGLVRDVLRAEKEQGGAHSSQLREALAGLSKWLPHIKALQGPPCSR